MSAFYCPTCLTTFVVNGDTCTNLGCGSRRPPGGWGDLLTDGDLLDRHYRIERPLAVGGAGITYLARQIDEDHVPLPPDLAIKVLYAARAAGSFLHRLSTEAQILQELDHPNIVQLRGFVHRAGHEPYLVTLFEHGGNLTEHLEAHGALPPRVATGIVLQVLAALDVAHQRGIVHRDLKPDNVLLTARADLDAIPRVRVADFGIAKVSGAMGRVTKMGTFIGTPEYAAPEQFEGMEPTPAADVFAAGALLLHLLHGRAPVAFSNRLDIEQCHREWLDALPPKLDGTEMRETTPVEAAVLDEVLGQMMRPEPQRRCTVQAVIARLRGIADGDARLQRKDTVEVTGRPAPDRSASPAADDPGADDGAPSTPPAAELPSLGDDTTARFSDGASARPPPAPAEPPPTLEPVPETLDTLASPPNEPSSGGRGGCLAAVAGLGVAGMGLIAAAAVIAVLVLAGAAWQLGYFDATVATAPRPAPDPRPASGPASQPGPSPPAPGVPSPTPPVPGVPSPVPGVPPPPSPVPGAPRAGDLPSAPLALDAEGHARVRERVDAHRDALARCKVPGRVAGVVWVRDGAVIQARLDGIYGSADALGCVEQALVGTSIEGTGWVRVGL